MEGISDHYVSPGRNKTFRKGPFENLTNQEDGKSIRGLRKVNRLILISLSMRYSLYERPLVERHILRDLLKYIKEEKVNGAQASLGPIVQNCHATRLFLIRDGNDLPNKALVLFTGKQAPK